MIIDSSSSTPSESAYASAEENRRAELTAEQKRGDFVRMFQVERQPRPASDRQLSVGLVRARIVAGVLASAKALRAGTPAAPDQGRPQPGGIPGILLRSAQSPPVQTVSDPPARLESSLQPGERAVPAMVSHQPGVADPLNTVNRAMRCLKRREREPASPAEASASSAHTPEHSAAPWLPHTVRLEATQPHLHALAGGDLPATVREIVEFAEIGRNADGLAEFSIGLTDQASGRLRLRIIAHGKRRLSIRFAGGRAGASNQAMESLIASLRENKLEIVEVARDDHRR